ncbi:hypothetical protein IC582_004377 [Cucumis melo]
METWDARYETTCHILILVKQKLTFHGVSTNKDETVFDGSEATVRIDAEALLASEKLTPAAILNKVRERRD